MGNVSRASLVASAIVLLGLLPASLASPAALDAWVASGPPDLASGGTRGGYLNPVVVADTAGTLTLVNLDLAAHDIVSDALGPTDNPWCQRYVNHHFCPLFASRLAGLGEETVVEGTDQLVPGATYPFFCSVHHWMTGTLVAI